MPAHKFRIGQRAIYAPTGMSARSVGPSEFEIVRKLPVEGLDPLYRIKAVGGVQERVVKEAELQPLSP